MAEILEVDLTKYENGSKEQKKVLIEGVRRSLSETSFVIAKHDLSEGLIDEAYGDLQSFYSKDFDEKMEWNRPKANGQTGYVPVGGETGAGDEATDFKEMWNFSTPLPPGHPYKKTYPLAYPPQVLPDFLAETLFPFHTGMAELQRKFLRVMAQSFGAHEEFFESSIKMGPTLTRSIHYPSMADAPKTDEPHIWASKHRDINLTTVLPKATAKGLQVLVDDKWEDVVAPDGYVILNTGIMADYLTNGLIKGGWHRVVADPDYDGDRYSVVQFCHPTPATILSPLASCITDDNPQKYMGISASDALSEVLYDIGLIPAVDEEDPHAGGMM